MEAYEQLVAAALSSEGFVVQSSIKFPVSRQTRRKDRVEIQTHGYEVDLIGCRQDRLVIASVKSFFGSSGMNFEEVSGSGREAGRYRIINDPELRRAIVRAAARRYGFKVSQTQMRLYSGKCNTNQEDKIRSWCATQRVGGSSIQFHTARETVAKVLDVSRASTYQDDAVLSTIKALDYVKALNWG